MVVHLNVHTAYDLLQSTVRIDELVQLAAADGQTALAVTDTNVMFGVHAFYKACTAAGIKPIIGMTVQVTDGVDSVETVLLARNKSGFDHLMKLSSKIQLKSLDHIPYSVLEQYQKDTVVIFKKLPQHMAELLKRCDTAYTCHLSHIPQAEQVYMNDIRYLRSDGLADLKVMQAIDGNEKLALEAVRIQTGEHYFRRQEELIGIGCDEAVQRTEHIAALCDVDLAQTVKKLPKFPTPAGESSDEYLWQLIEQGKDRISDFDERYERRVKKEYDIITSMGFSDYFLIVGDLIHYAKQQGILVGPGRGSSGGSLISYLLDITTIDPIEHELYFERFLNPERVTMPDIDIDFEDTRRDEVIDYCINRYGAFNVAGIVTFGHLLARAVMRDVGRILQFPDSDLKQISNYIPKKLGITLDEALEQDNFRMFVEQDDRHRQWFNIASHLEGLPRHTSTHAAGIIIHDQLLTDYVPLLKGDGMHLTQWTMTEVEEIGLLKIDFLGLRNLTIIQRVTSAVGSRITTETVDYHDENVFKRLAKADTTGIFQLESSGIRNVLKQLQPQDFEDIVAVLALYRPGPMEQIPVYIARRHGAAVEYLHADLAPILTRTYGVIIYQEQIMQIATTFAGFTPGQADNLRRAMSKKKREVLEQQKRFFIEGSIANGYDETTAAEIYALILKFADYGFPRAHAVAYAKIAYLMMYLKVHHPPQFYAAIMSNVIGSEDKLRELIVELKMNHIPFKAPSINHSHWYFKAVDDGIQLSLGMIKGIGYRSAMEIIEERKKGPFKDIHDFCHRISKKIVTKAMLEALILTGAFDEFNVNRATLLASLDDILDVGNDSTGDSFLEELGFNLKKSYRQQPEMSEEQKTAYEFQYLGFFLSAHPVEKVFDSHLYLPLYKINQLATGRYILCTLQSVRRIRTKKGQPMAFVQVMDGTAELELVIFPDSFKQSEQYLNQDAVIVVKGKVDDAGKLLVDELVSFEQFKEHYLQHIKEIYVLKAPVQPLVKGTIRLCLYHMEDQTSEQLDMIDERTARNLLEQYPPEMIRVI